MDKVFLRYRKGEPERGVEVFNLELIHDLVGLGIPLTVPAVRGWCERVAACGAPPGLTVAPAVSGIGDAAAGWLWAGRWNLPRFQILILGNVGKGVVPMIRRLQRRRCFRRAVLIAHREATDTFARWMARLPGTVVAVNEQIAERFRRAGHSRVTVDYGVTHADWFYPSDRNFGRAEDVVHFAVIGWLDNPWKGADTALAAFRSLPDRVRSRCMLHLASFSEPPVFPEANVRAYPWMPFQAVPGFLRAMDVLLVPSRDEVVMRETFCQAMVQGMLTGLPVVVNRVPVLTEKINQGGGLVVDSIPALAEAMERLSGDRGLRDQLGREGRAIALQRYVWDTARFVQRYLGDEPRDREPR